MTRRRRSRRCISRDAVRCSTCAEGSLCARACRQQAAHPLEIFRRIHADGIMARFDHPDGKTVLERTQLLERFTAFEGRWRKRRQPQKKFTAVDVETDMFMRTRRGALRASRVRDARTREI